MAINLNMGIEIELPYITVNDAIEQIRHITPHDIRPLDKEKRLRVYKGQLMDAVLENINTTNYLFHVSIFFKHGYRLANKFPEHFTEIEDATMVFWTKVQCKLKEMKSKKE